jgi:hypothetical protein
MTVRVFRADRPMHRARTAPAVALATPGDGGVVAGRAEVRAALPANEPAQVTFRVRPVGAADWTTLGTDDNPPYRVFHDVSAFPQGTLLEYRALAKGLSGAVSAAVGWGVVGTPPPPAGGGGGVGDVEQPAAAAIAGTLNSDFGCVTAGGDPEDWAPWCDQAQMTLDPNDKIWKGTWTIPAGPYAYKVALNRTWDENYGSGAVRNGANIEITSDGSPLTFYYDHRTHWVVSDSEVPIVVAAGSFQSEMGCSGDWDPACMRSWLQDPDGDGVFSLATTQIPAGSYEVKATVGLSWDVNYGAGGVPNGANIAFSVPGDGLITTLSYDSVSHVLSVSTASAQPVPDLSVADAMWLDGNTIAYPLDRLPAGTDAAWLRYRLHWGELAVDATTLGGSSAALGLVTGAPDGHLALRLDRETVKRLRDVPASTLRAVGVYDDAGTLVDATAVAPPP